MRFTPEYFTHIALVFLLLQVGCRTAPQQTQNSGLNADCRLCVEVNSRGEALYHVHLMESLESSTLDSGLVELRQSLERVIAPLHSLMRTHPVVGHDMADNLLNYNVLLDKNLRIPDDRLMGLTQLPVISDLSDLEELCELYCLVTLHMVTIDQAMHFEKVVAEK